MIVWRTLIAITLSASILAACGGDDDSSDTSGNTDGPTIEDATPAPTSSGPPTSEPARPQGTIAVPTAPSRPEGEPFTIEDATAMLDAVLLKPVDLPASWMIQSDTTLDNAAAAAAAPDQAASIQRCGRLLSRTITNFPPDSVAAFLANTSLSFFSTATVYETPEGQADCTAEAAVRLADPSGIAKAFGQVFVDPAAVEVRPVDYPAVGDGSFAAYLTGEVDASGNIIPVTILVVAFSRGNTTAAVGSAYSGIDPPTGELEPYVDAVLARIDEWQ
jgi:hypothetical protein